MKGHLNCVEREGGKEKRNLDPVSSTFTFVVVPFNSYLRFGKEIGKKK